MMDSKSPADRLMLPDVLVRIAVGINFIAWPSILIYFILK